MVIVFQLVLEYGVFLRELINKLFFLQSLGQIQRILENFAPSRENKRFLTRQLMVHMTPAVIQVSRRAPTWTHSSAWDPEWDTHILIKRSNLDLTSIPFKVGIWHVNLPAAFSWALWRSWSHPRLEVPGFTTAGFSPLPELQIPYSNTELCPWQPLADPEDGKTLAEFPPELRAAGSTAWRPPAPPPWILITRASSPPSRLFNFKTSTWRLDSFFFLPFLPPPCDRLLSLKAGALWGKSRLWHAEGERVGKIIIRVN